MNKREGCRRIVISLACLVMIGIWVEGFFRTFLLCVNANNNFLFTGCTLTLFAGILVAVICYGVGMWLVKGFFDDQKKQE